MSGPSIDTVFVFGAGASADCSLPLMRNFGAQVSKLAAASSKSDDIANDLKEIDSLLNSPPTAHLGWFDPENMEHVFSLLEMRAEMGDSSARKKLESLERVIDFVFANSCLSDDQASKRNTKVSDTLAYVKLLGALKQVYGKEWLSGKPPFVFITLNYDLAVEHAWRHELSRNDDLRLKCVDDYYEGEFIAFDDDKRKQLQSIMEDDNTSKVLPFARYGLLGADGQLELRTYPLTLKLHGSLNWGICRECGRVSVIDLWSTGDISLKVFEWFERSRCREHVEVQHSSQFATMSF